MSPPGLERPIRHVRCSVAIGGIRWGNRSAACGELKILGAALQADGSTRSRICGLKHQKEKRSMDYFAGLDVSVKETSICIVDDTGKIVREVKVASEPRALLAVLGRAQLPG